MRLDERLIMTASGSSRCTPWISSTHSVAAARLKTVKDLTPTNSSKRGPRTVRTKSEPSTTGTKQLGKYDSRRGRASCSFARGSGIKRGIIDLNPSGRNICVWLWADPRWLRRLPADCEKLGWIGYKGTAEPFPYGPLTNSFERQFKPPFRYWQEPGRSAQTGAVTRNEIGNSHRRRIRYDECLLAGAGIAKRRSDGRIEILDRKHGSSSRQRFERQWNRQARDPEDGRKISFCAFAINHDRTQDCKWNTCRADGLFGGEF